MTYVLGLNAYHADAAACLVKDGALVAAVEEERFRRIKHWAGFPTQSIRYCLAEAGIGLGDVDHVAVNQDNRANRWRKLAYVLTSGVGPGYVLDRLRQRGDRADVAGQSQAASARAGIPRRRARRRAPSVPPGLGLPASRRSTRRWRSRSTASAISPRRLGDRRGGDDHRSTAASTSRIRSACSTRR